MLFCSGCGIHSSVIHLSLFSSLIYHFTSVVLVKNGVNIMHVCMYFVCVFVRLCRCGRAETHSGKRGTGRLNVTTQSNH